MKDIKIWTQNREQVSDSILKGAEIEETLTHYGANEFAIDFLMHNGIWKQLMMEPKRGKNNNGKDWKKLSGMAILLELLPVGQLSYADKIIKDAKLMMELGFTFTEIETAKQKEKGVIHRDTLRNYFKAIPSNKSMKEFYSYINFFREKRWLRGKTYVADGFDIEVFGETYEGIGKKYDSKESRWKYGYKVVILMNVEEDRERIVGFAMGPINTDERALLLKIFEDLEKYVDKVKNIMDVIVLDRGYWGYDFLEKTIVGKYGIDYVIIAKKDFLFVKEDLRHLIDSKQLHFQERNLYNRSEDKWESVKVAFVKDLFHGYKNKKEGFLGTLNVVVMKKKEGKEEKEVIYVTNKKVPKNPLKIVQLYGCRWTIENKGIRDLSQRWKIRTLPGRTLNAVTARIALVLKLYNAMKVMEMKNGKEWQQNKDAIKKMGEKSFIGGFGLIVYTEEHFATLSPKEFERLIAERTRRITNKETNERIALELSKLKDCLPEDRLQELRHKLLI